MSRLPRSKNSGTQAHRIVKNFSPTEFIPMFNVQGKYTIPMLIQIGSKYLRAVGRNDLGQGHCSSHLRTSRDSG